MSLPNTILFFDSDCHLCNRTIQFIIKNDKKKRIKFASLQKAMEHGVVTKEDNLNSVVLMHEGNFFLRSDATLEILRILGGFWQVLYLCKLVPTFFRNTIYDWVAKNRYRWFGKNTVCWLPTPDIKSRFYDF